MKTPKTIVLLLSIVMFITTFIFSCASVQTVDPELRRKAANLPIISVAELGDQDYRIISEVLGVSCARQAGSDPSMEGAEQEMRVEAAKINADAVINVFCEEGGVTFRRNCWKTIECRGDAIEINN